MSIAELKQNLHNKIDAINDESLLEEVQCLINKTGQEFVLDEEIERLIADREIQLLNGSDRGFSFEDLEEKIKIKYGF